LQALLCDRGACSIRLWTAH